MKVLGIDPGTCFCGLALIDTAHPEEIEYLWTLCHAVVKPDPIVDNQAWFRRLWGFTRKYKPEVIVYENYVCQGKRMADNAIEMLQLLGAIQCLGTVAPYPSIEVCDPMVWRRQLLGSWMPARTGHMDAVVQMVLKARFPDDDRLRISCLRDSHYLDALGIVLAWADTRNVLLPGRSVYASPLCDDYIVPTA